MYKLPVIAAQAREGAVPTRRYLTSTVGIECVICMHIYESGLRRTCPANGFGPQNSPGDNLRGPIHKNDLTKSRSPPSVGLLLVNPTSKVQNHKSKTISPN